ncbi:hypothetical protein [Trueperella sp. LYQ143]|uniref:hypothetical protein n=1 Tax=Trueperella sp. LYQ143 TaxID=3391059 RepID=UPI0039832BEA
MLRLSSKPHIAGALGIVGVCVVMLGMLLLWRFSGGDAARDEYEAAWDEYAAASEALAPSVDKGESLVEGCDINVGDKALCQTISELVAEGKTALDQSKIDVESADKGAFASAQATLTDTTAKVRELSTSFPPVLSRADELIKTNAENYKDRQLSLVYKDAAGIVGEVDGVLGEVAGQEHFAQLASQLKTARDALATSVERADHAMKDSGVTVLELSNFFGDLTRDMSAVDDARRALTASRLGAINEAQAAAAAAAAQEQALAAARTETNTASGRGYSASGSSSLGGGNLNTTPPPSNYSSSNDNAASREEAINKSYYSNPGDNLGGGWVDTSTGGLLCGGMDTEGNGWVYECP